MGEDDFGMFRHPAQLIAYLSLCSLHAESLHPPPYTLMADDSNGVNLLGPTYTETLTAPPRARPASAPTNPTVPETLSPLPTQSVRYGEHSASIAPYFVCSDPSVYYPQYTTRFLGVQLLFPPSMPLIPKMIR